MQTRRLGQTDIEVSIIGLGTVKFGRNEGVKYPAAFTLPTDCELEQLLMQARELGINLLDTAPAYGSSEERLGALLKHQRQDWILATKVGEEFNHGESQFDFSKDAIQHSIERSLQRLHTDYLDIVLVHSSGDDVRIIQEEQVFETLSLLKQQGKIRAFGMSTKSVAGGLLTIDRADLAMVTYNPAATEDRVVIERAHSQQKGILIKKALGSGHLHTLGTDDPVATSMRFILREPGVSSIIVGTINPEHLRMNVDCALG